MKKFVSLVRGTARRFSDDGGTFMAQALAFNAIFAIFPLAILIVAALGYVYGSTDGQARAFALIGSFAPEVRSVLAENIRQAIEFRGLSGLIALVALLWSGKNLFQGLAYALNRALDIPTGRPLLSDILVALVMVPILGTLFVVATAVPLGISFIVRYGGLRDAAMVTTLAGYGTGLILIFVVTLVLYTYLPNRRVGLSFAVPGAIFVTVAWELAQIAFALYTTHVDYSHVYGALGAFALLLIWFYYMATIFLFGAELCAETAAPS